MKMKSLRSSAIACLIAYFIYTPCYAKTSDKLPLPRFASIKSKEVNARTGPGYNYPIEWTYIKKNEPVEVYAEYEHWRRIRDCDGDGGWVHNNMIIGKRFIIIKSSKAVNLYYGADNKEDEIIAHLMPEVRCQLNSCNIKMCNISCEHKRGWVERQNLWGVYTNE